MDEAAKQVAKQLYCALKQALEAKLAVRCLKDDGERLVFHSERGITDEELIPVVNRELEALGLVLHQVRTSKGLDGAIKQAGKPVAILSVSNATKDTGRLFLSLLHFKFP